MKIKSIGIIFLFALGLSACQTSPQPYDLYLLIGQSNMAGRGAVEAVDKTAHPRVFMLNKDEQWVPATEPLHFDKPKRIGTGPGLAFGKAMAGYDESAKIGLIPSAVGGSVIASWQPGGYHKQTDVYPYDDAVSRARAAQEVGRLKAILWHQGEYDSKVENVPLYKEALKQLAANLRAALGGQDIPFIVGGLGDFLVAKRPASKDINAILQDAPNFIANSGFASAQGLGDKGDKLHFSSRSYRILGERYAQTLQDMTPSR